MISVNQIKKKLDKHTDNKDLFVQMGEKDLPDGITERQLNATLDFITEAGTRSAVALTDHITDGGDQRTMHAQYVADDGGVLFSTRAHATGRNNITATLTISSVASSSDQMKKLEDRLKEYMSSKDEKVEEKAA